MSIAAKLIKDVLDEQKSSGHAEGELKVPKYGKDHTPTNHDDNKNMKVVKDPAKGLDQRNDKKPKADVGQARKEKGRDHRVIKPKVSEQRQALTEQNPNPIVQALNLRVVDQHLTFQNPQADGKMYKLPWGKEVRSAVTKFVVNNSALSNPAKAASELYEKLIGQNGVELAQQAQAGASQSLNASLGDVDPKNILKMRNIVANHQYEEIDGQVVDAYTASAIIQVYDALGTPENKAKLASMSIPQMSDIAFKVIQRANTNESAGGGTAHGEMSTPSYSDDDPSYSKKNRTNQPLDDKNKGDPGMVKKSEKRAGKDGLMDANPAKVEGPKVGIGQIAEKKVLENLLGRKLQLTVGE